MEGGYSRKPFYQHHFTVSAFLAPVTTFTIIISQHRTTFNYSTRNLLIYLVNLIVMNCRADNDKNNCYNDPESQFF